MLSSQQIDEHMAWLTTALNRLPTDDGDLSACLEIHERFEALRAQYREKAESLSGRVSALTELSRRFDDWLAKRVTRVIDRFAEVNEQLRRIEEEKALWRDFLIRTATTARQEYLKGAAATVRVRAIASRPLPPAGSPQRSELEEVIRQSGHWEQVSQIASAKMQHALAAKLFDETQVHAIERLCPAAVIYQVSSRPLD